MKKLLLLLIAVIMISNPSFSQIQNYHTTPGDLLITSANRQLGGYLCYGIFGGLMLYAAQQDQQDTEMAKIVNRVAIGFSAVGTGLLISAVLKKRRAGEKLNELGLHLGATSDGLTLSWAF